MLFLKGVFKMRCEDANVDTLVPKILDLKQASKLKILEPHTSSSNKALQGLSVPVACVGSGDHVRVLCLYTTNTLDEV